MKFRQGYYQTENDSTSTILSELCEARITIPVHDGDEFLYYYTTDIYLPLGKTIDTFSEEEKLELADKILDTIEPGPVHNVHFNYGYDYDDITIEETKSNNMNNSELQEIKDTIQQLSDRITELETRRISDKQYFEYLADQAISKLKVIPDFDLYRENVEKLINSKFSSLEHRLLNEQSQIIRNRLGDLPSELIEDRKLLIKLLKYTTDVLRELGSGIGSLSHDFKVKLGEMDLYE